MAQNIVLIDDNENLLRVMCEVLQNHFSTTTITTFTVSDEALVYFGTHKPDLVITDFRLLPLNGLQLLHEARTQGIRCPFILITAFQDPRIEQVAKKFGVYRLLTKPFHFDKLIAVAEEALNDEFAIRMSNNGAMLISEELYQAVFSTLQTLKSELQPSMVVMAHTSGHEVTHLGEIEQVDVATIISLIAGLFASAHELNRLLGKAGDTPADPNGLTNLLYQEGDAYDTYSAYIGREFFLSLLFERSSNSKMGIIWLQMRRALSALRTAVMHKDADADKDAAAQTLNIKRDDDTVLTSFRKLFQPEPITNNGHS